MSSDQEQQIPGAPPEAFSQALGRLLQPLVRLLMHFGITYPYIINQLKWIFIDVAEAHFAVEEGKRQSDSRISLITGVHRKDVRRIRNEHHEETTPDKNVSTGAQLVALWISDKRFCDSKQRPKSLPRLAAKSNSKINFETLVEVISKGDLRPRVVLDELLRLGVVCVDEDDCVALNTEAFIPQHGFDEKAFFFGKNIHDHIAAGADNLMASMDDEAPEFFDRCVYYDGLSEESIEQLSQLSAQLSMDVLKTINKKARSLQKQDGKKDIEKHRMNLGIFYYHTEENEADDSLEEL